MAGRLAGDAVRPPQLTPLAMRGDHVYGIWRDELGVNCVVRYRLERLRAGLNHTCAALRLHDLRASRPPTTTADGQPTLPERRRRRHTWSRQRGTTRRLWGRHGSGERVDTPGSEDDLKPDHTSPRGLDPSARSDIPPFIVMDVMDAAARIERGGGHVIHLEVGQPVAPAPSTAIAAAQAALAGGRIAYTAALGIPSLRARIAAYYRERYGLDVEEDRVVVTTGSSGGFILAFLALFDPGDRVAVASPGYPPYRHTLSTLGCEPVLIDTGPETRWSITPDALLEIHRQRPLAGVIIASPANPTGTMMPATALRALIEAADDTGIRVVSDEIYHGLDYAFPAETALRFSDRALVVNSFSKYFCMTGWRVGWMVVPKSFVRSIERLQQNLLISVPAISQVAAEAAFDGRDELEAVKRGYEENRRILLEGLPAAGLDQILPVDGAFYLYADISHFADDSLDFTRRMLEEARVAATPGVDFDPIYGHRFLRFCYAGSAEEMREAVERIRRWMGL